MKMDHLRFFINIKFLASVDSPFYVEYNGESLKSKTNDHNFNFQRSIYRNS